MAFQPPFLMLNSNLHPKVLWTGSFTSGSIVVPHLGDYMIFLVSVGGAPCIGTCNYGGCVIGSYGSYAIGSAAYRFDARNNTLIIDGTNKGGTFGTENVAVDSIIGLILN